MQPFHAPEKSLELVFPQNAPTLLQEGRAFWQDWLNPVGVMILSEIQNPFCRAFLLSESSLFVFQQKLLLITCGHRLSEDAATKLSSHDLLKNWAEKNWDEICLLEEKNLVLQEKPEVRGPIFVGCPARRRTAFMDLNPSALAHFTGNNWTLPGLTIFNRHFNLTDKHIFTTPAGFSANFLGDTQYACVHISPTAKPCYASLESNLDAHTHDILAAALCEDLRPEKVSKIS